MVKTRYSAGFRDDAFPYPLLITCLAALPAAAQDGRGRSDPALMHRQLHAIELLADRARSSAFDTDLVRYRFDYSRLGRIGARPARYQHLPIALTCAAGRSGRAYR